MLRGTAQKREATEALAEKIEFQSYLKLRRIAAGVVQYTKNNDVVPLS